MKRRPLARYVPPVLALWSACSPPPAPSHDYDGAIGVDWPDTQPDIVVDPEIVDFGTVAPSRWGEHRVTVTIGNVGDADLQIQNIELEDGTDVFEISYIQSVLVPPDNSTWFEVALAPLSPGVLIEDYLLIDSNDPDEPVYQLPVYAEAAWHAADDPP